MGKPAAFFIDTHLGSDVANRAVFLKFSGIASPVPALRARSYPLNHCPPVWRLLSTNSRLSPSLMASKFCAAVANNRFVFARAFSSTLDAPVSAWRDDLVALVVRCLVWLLIEVSSVTLVEKGMMVTLRQVNRRPG
jgi:hypothetical protein